MKIPAEESAFEKAHITEGIHHAELMGISDAPDGQYGPRVALDFNVYYSMKEGPARIGRVFGKKLTPKSKLWESIVALGGKPEVGKDFDMDSLLGNPCRVMVEDYEDNDGKTVSGINKVKTPNEKTSEYLSEAKEKLKNIKENADNDPVPVEKI
ncbi:hypothetical protein ACFL0O_00410 [Thermodesulfobacteriota bacterium]